MVTFKIHIVSTLVFVFVSLRSIECPADSYSIISSDSFFNVPVNFNCFDSVLIKTNEFDGCFDLANSNYINDGIHSMVSFSEKYNLQASIISNKRVCELIFRSELSYDGIIDSSWHKKIDDWLIKIDYFENKDLKFNHSYLFKFQTGLLPFSSHEYSQNGNQHLVRRSSILNPGLIELSYGLKYLFSTTSSVNISFATITCEVIRPIGFYYDFVKLKGYKWKSQYGFSINFIINCPLSSRFSINNESELFANSIEIKECNFQTRSKVQFVFSKLLTFSFDYQAKYNPILYKSIQQSSDFRLGIHVDLRNHS